MNTLHILNYHSLPIINICTEIIYEEIIYVLKTENLFLKGRICVLIEKFCALKTQKLYKKIIHF